MKLIIEERKDEMKEELNGHREKEGVNKERERRGKEGERNWS